MKPTRQQIIDVFRNSMLYEIVFTFGVPHHDTNDPFNWEAINFNRIAHARLLYDFLEQPASKRYRDNVLSEDFGFAAADVPLPQDDRHRLNKDMMHLTYDRLRHTPLTKPWPDSIISCLHDPIIAFMKSVQMQTDLFADAEHLRIWNGFTAFMESGRQIIMRKKTPTDGPFIVAAGTSNTTSTTMVTDMRKSGEVAFDFTLGRTLPSGKAALTRLGEPL